MDAAFVDAAAAAAASAWKSRPGFQHDVSAKVLGWERRLQGMFKGLDSKYVLYKVAFIMTAAIPGWGHRLCTRFNSLRLHQQSSRGVSDKRQSISYGSPVDLYIPIQGAWTYALLRSVAAASVRGGDGDDVVTTLGRSFRCAAQAWLLNWAVLQICCAYLWGGVGGGLAMPVFALAGYAYVPACAALIWRLAMPLGIGGSLATLYCALCWAMFLTRSFVYAGVLGAPSGQGRSGARGSGAVAAIFIVQAALQVFLTWSY